MSEHLHESVIKMECPDFNNCSMQDIIAYKEKIIIEYNKLTEPYRMLMMKVDEKIENKQQQIYRECSHDYERFSEYHNERYYLCRICGHEK